MYLFRLQEGAVETSFALQVAQAHGLTRTVADRATQVCEIKFVIHSLCLVKILFIVRNKSLCKLPNWGTRPRQVVLH